MAGQRKPRCAAPSRSSAARSSTPWLGSAGLPMQNFRGAGAMRRQQLTETQTAALFDPPTEPRELIRHYTLSAGDLAIVHRCRGEHNRLGCALMLCYLRYPGRPLRAGERPPAELTAFVAERNRQRHAVECQERLRLRPFGKHAAAGLADVLHPHACENDRLFHLAELVMEECRRRRIVVPGPRRLERLFSDCGLPVNQPPLLL